jgi:hypothetical protein
MNGSYDAALEDYLRIGVISWSEVKSQAFMKSGYIRVPVLRLWGESVVHTARWYLA